MKYKIGDKVRFLNDVGGGTVSKIINSNMVHVMDEDGFEIPAMVGDIVVVGEVNHNNFKKPEPQPQVIKESEPVTAVKQDEPVVYIDGDMYELLLAFVPKNQKDIANSDIDVYFVNDSSYYCMYALSHWTKADKLKLMGRNDIEPELKEYVYTIERAELNTKINLNVTCFLYKHKHDYKLYPPEQVNIELNPVKFVKASTFTENDFFDENAYILKVAVSGNNTIAEMDISPKEIEKAIREKKDNRQRIIPQKPAPEIEEIDLHIEQLVDNAQGLDNGQIVEIQLARFTTALELGIGAGTKRMVFIHGVGNGKLKHEIRRLLDTQYAGKVRYQDASFKEYGYGATMVII